MFNLFINKLFKNDNEIIDKEKRSILLVSRPADSIWESKEKEYAALLKKKLNIKDYSQAVDIVIVSESQAVCALVARNGGLVSPTENAVIIKCGSSSFDMAVVRQGNIPANWEYSRPFGVRKIEDLMLKQILNEQPGKKPVIPTPRVNFLWAYLRSGFMALKMNRETRN